MRNTDHWDADREYERDNEREPARQTTRRPRPQLTSYGTLRLAHETAIAARKAGAR